MNTLYAMVNVYGPDKKWLGQFRNESTAQAWLKIRGIDVAKCEISNRRPEWKRDTK